jgi:hypothetical protein
MWAGLHFINGYSPILPAGVARDFKFFIHGEIDADMGRYLVQNESGPAGILEELGVDGIIVAREISVEPALSGWELKYENDEGRVFHRKGEPLSRVRSVVWIDSLPEREFVTATISGIQDKRNLVTVDVDIPTGGLSALLTFSRPYFRGYQAQIGNRALRVDSYRGLFPIVEVPAGSRGHLTLIYRPWWLVVGGAASILCALVWLLGMVSALRGRST